MRINFTININDEFLKKVKSIFKKRNLFVLFILLIFSSAVLFAGVRKSFTDLDSVITFNDGDTIYSAEINQNFSDIISNIETNNSTLKTNLEESQAMVDYLENQVTSIKSRLLGYQSQTLANYGLIILWYGKLTEVPEGWALCDGTGENNTEYVGDVKIPDLRKKFVLGASKNAKHGQYSEGGSYDHSHLMQHKHDGAFLSSSNLTGNTYILNKHKFNNTFEDNDCFSIAGYDDPNFINSNLIYEYITFNKISPKLKIDTGDDDNLLKIVISQSDDITYRTGDPVFDSPGDIGLNINYSSLVSNYDSTGTNSANAYFCSATTKLPRDISITASYNPIEEAEDSLYTGRIDITTDAFKNDIKNKWGHLPKFKALVYIIYVGNSYKETKDILDAEERFDSSDF